MSKNTNRADVNHDGTVDSHDVMEVVGAVMTGSADENYDVDGNKKVNINDVAAAVDASIATVPWNGEVEINGVSFKMIPIKPGTFLMGTLTELGMSTIETPQHEVTITKGFFIGETQVTQELWEAVMGNNPSHFKGEPKRPVEQVSWNDCQEFIAHLNANTGKNFRLPTEAEWEFAARGGTKSQGYRYAGSNNPKEVAWYVSNSKATTQPVAGKTPNELGIYDMSGNVAEWVNDWYGRYPSAPLTDPTGPASGSFRVYRNGGFSDKAANIRAAWRYMESQTYKQPFLGMRLAIDA